MTQEDASDLRKPVWTIVLTLDGIPVSGVEVDQKAFKHPKIEVTVTDDLNSTTHQNVPLPGNDKPKEEKKWIKPTTDDYTRLGKFLCSIQPDKLKFFDDLGYASVEECLGAFGTNKKSLFDRLMQHDVGFDVNFATALVASVYSPKVQVWSYTDMSYIHYLETLTSTLDVTALTALPASKGVIVMLCRCYEAARMRGALATLDQRLIRGRRVLVCIMDQETFLYNVWRENKYNVETALAEFDYRQDQDVTAVRNHCEEQGIDVDICLADLSGHDEITIGNHSLNTWDVLKQKGVWGIDQIQTWLQRQLSSRMGTL